MSAIAGVLILNARVIVGEFGTDGASVMILDELDSGVGSRLGGPVGQMLRRMSASSSTSAAAQIICVSHLPQVKCPHQLSSISFFTISALEHLFDCRVLTRAHSHACLFLFLALPEMLVPGEISDQIVLELGCQCEVTGPLSPVAGCCPGGAPCCCTQGDGCRWARADALCSFDRGGGASGGSGCHVGSGHHRGPPNVAGCVCVTLFVCSCNQSEPLPLSV